MKRKFLVFVLLIIVAIFLMNVGSVYAGKVSLMMWGGAIEEKEMKGYLAAFNEENPDVKVEIIRPADYWPKLMSMMAAGTPPDVFYMGFPEFVSYHEKGAILNLQSYISADPNFNESDFFPGLLGAFKDRNTKEIFGIPKDWSTYVLYYNKAMFKKAGLPTPNEMFGCGQWSWQDFLNTAKKLTKDGVHGVALDAGRWKVFPPQGGANWVQGVNKVVVDTPEFAEAIQFNADLWLKHNVAPDMTEQADQGPSDRFAHEKAAMYICGRWKAMGYKDLDFEWDIAPLPYNKGMYTWVDLVAYCVAKDSKNPDDAYKLASFLTGKKGQEIMAAEGHAIPSRRSIAYSPEFADVLPERGIHNTVHLMPYYETMLVFNHWGEVWTAINRALEPVWMGEEKAEDALQKAQKEIDRLMTE